MSQGNGLLEFEDFVANLQDEGLEVIADGITTLKNMAEDISEVSL